MIDDVSEPVAWDPDGLVTISERDDVMSAVRRQVGDVDFRVLAVAPILHDRRYFRSLAVLVGVVDDAQVVIAPLKPPPSSVSQRLVERVLRDRIEDYRDVLAKTEALLQMWITRRVEPRDEDD